MRDIVICEWLNGDFYDVKCFKVVFVGRTELKSLFFNFTTSFDDQTALSHIISALSTWKDFCSNLSHKTLATSRTETLRLLKRIVFRATILEIIFLMLKVISKLMFPIFSAQPLAIVVSIRQTSNSRTVAHADNQPLPWKQRILARLSPRNFHTLAVDRR